MFQQTTVCLIVYHFSYKVIILYFQVLRAFSKCIFLNCHFTQSCSPHLFCAIAAILCHCDDCVASPSLDALPSSKYSNSNSKLHASMATKSYSYQPFSFIILPQFIQTLQATTFTAHTFGTLNIHNQYLHTFIHV